MKKLLILMILGLFGLYPFLLCANADLDLFNNGKIKVFTSLSYKKAKGLDFTFKYPETWKVIDGDHPNVLVKIHNNEGKYAKGITVLVKDMPDELKAFSEKEVADAIFDKNDLVSLMPKGSGYIGGGVTKFDGQPGAWCEYKTIQSRAGINMVLYVLQYSLIYKQKMIVLTCSVGGATDSLELKKMYQSYKPLFSKIALSILLKGKWVNK